MLERILASHSQVHAAGELQAFPTETIKAVQRNAGRAIGKLEFVERALDTDPRALGRAYLAAAHPQAAEKVRWVDKQPLNYLYAGMIARALPRARIIALARDPIDSCFAMYKTLFAGAYPFSYDLSDLGQYYAAWHRLMRHWQAVLGERLLIVHYEDLVDDQEPVTREILAHCGLDWENACLAFQEQRSAVTTASAVQVRQGMYSSSIGKWRRFERQLAPLTEFLERHKPIGGWRLTPKVRGKLEE
jgi:Sulfotransferase family